MKKRIQFVQQHLNEKGLDAGPEDGILGPQTIDALNQVEGIPSEWSNRRKVIGFIQLLARERNIETGSIDGLWGPQTQFAFESLQHLIEHGEPPPTWRPEDLPDENPNGWPRQTPEEELIQFYGEVNTSQVSVELPYPHRLSWDKSQIVNRFTCHEKVRESLRRILDRVLDHYGLDEIQRLRLDLWGGCLNVRKMRGGQRYSLHSWGIAVDYDPDHNRLNWGRDRAAFAGPEYASWWQFWEEEGWTSLGRARNFDWMHVQAAKL